MCFCLWLTIFPSLLYSSVISHCLLFRHFLFFSFPFLLLLLSYSSSFSSTSYSTSSSFPSPSPSPLPLIPPLLHYLPFLPILLLSSPPHIPSVLLLPLHPLLLLPFPSLFPIFPIATTSVLPPPATRAALLAHVAQNFFQLRLNSSSFS